MEFDVKPGYETVAEILQTSLDQAQIGKGKERHAPEKDAVPFEDQHLMQELRNCGLSAATYQIRKKALEAARLAERGNYEEAYEDLKGIIIHTVAQFMRTLEMETESKREEYGVYWKTNEVSSYGSLNDEMDS